MRRLNIAAVILAAGFSRRLGRPKQQELLGDETLLARSLRLAQEAGLSPVIAVVRPESTRLGLPDHILFIENPAAAEGMASSVRLGVEAAHHAGAQGIVILTCDQPFITPEHLRALCAVPTRITASEYLGRKGVPAYFPAAAFPELRKLTGDAGARHLLRSAAAILNEDLGTDIDTEEDLRQARTRLHQHP